MTDARIFVDGMIQRTQDALSNLDRQLSGYVTSTDVKQMLRVALRNELEAAELAAAWMVSSVDLDLKVLLARHAGDEAEHFNRLRTRLGELGVPVSERVPAPGMPTPLLNYLRSLDSPAEQLCAGFVTRETVALHKNAQFIEVCDKLGDRDTARLYRERIQPDELAHRDYGRALLEQVLPADEAGRERIEIARMRTLEIAGALTLTAARDKGLCGAPGC